LASATLRATVDSRVASAYASTNYGKSPTLQIGATGGVADRLSFLWWGIPFPSGAVVRYARLHVKVKGTWPSAATIVARRLLAAWKESATTWNTKPAGSTTDTATLAGATGPAGTDLTIDVTAIMAAIAAGAAWYGLSLETVANGVFGLSSKEDPTTSFRPYLDIAWDMTPNPPTNLRPSTGRAVSIARPVLAWSYSDPSGESPQTSAQIQVGTDSTFAGSILYDSGWVATTLSQLPLGADVPLGAAEYWRVRVQSAAGLSSGWSDPAAFTRTAKSAVVIDSPADGGIAEQTTPVVSWHYSPAGPVLAQASLVLERQDADGWHVVYTIDPYATAVASKEIPPGYITTPGQQYRVTVRVWDTVEREDTPGDPSYSEAVSTFTFTPTATVAPVTTLATALPVEHGPGVLLSFYRSVQPDYFAVIVDGAVVADRIDPTTIRDVPAGAGHYAYTFWGARPAQSSTYEVAAVVGSAGTYKQSTGNAVANATAEPWGVWIMRPTTGDAVMLEGTDTPDLAYGDDAATFALVGRRDPVVIWSTIRGYEGSVSGEVFDRASVATLDAIIAARDEVLRVSIGDLNIPVRLGPSPKVVPVGDERWAIELAVLQVDEFTVPAS
jgi:hypothetical protein